VTGRRKEVGKSKVVECGQLKWVQDSVICCRFLNLASLWSPGELIAQAVGGVAKAPFKRSGPETGKVQVSGRWAQRVAYANF
jgi:hypothetical protein